MKLRCVLLPTGFVFVVLRSRVKPFSRSCLLCFYVLINLDFYLSSFEWGAFKPAGLGTV